MRGAECCVAVKHLTSRRLEYGTKSSGGVCAGKRPLFSWQRNEGAREWPMICTERELENAEIFSGFLGCEVAFANWTAG